MGMKKLLVYVAGPYSSNPCHGTREACLAGSILYRAGYTPLVPHTNIVWDIVAPMSEQDWYDYTMDLLAACKPDLLLRLPGISPGSAREARFCEENGIPVFHGMAEQFVELDIDLADIELGRAAEKRIERCLHW